ncbi:XRE family transcriptional regulator [Lactococcus garvieae]
MTKTKLQIMREKAGMTIEQLAINALMTQAVDLDIYYNSLEFFGIVVANTVEELEISEKHDTSREKEAWKYVAQALGCSVEELVEE